MQSSGFFNSSSGDRRYSAEDWAAYFASFIGNGVFPNPSTGLQVMERENMSIQVMPGRAWVNGFFLALESPQVLVLDNADGVVARIDRVVVRLDTTERTVTLAVKKGAFAQTPVPQEVERTTTIYELALADVYVGAGAVSIAQLDIIDMRLNSNLCGIVHGVIDQVDTTTIFNQYMSWFRTFSGRQRDDFLMWFNTIKDVLDESTAGNLLNLIAAHEQQSVASEEGVHGLRYHDGLLGFFNGDDWDEIKTGGSGGVVVQETEPEDTGLLWIKPSDGMGRYYDGTWKIMRTGYAP